MGLLMHFADSGEETSTEYFAFSRKKRRGKEGQHYNSQHQTYVRLFHKKAFHSIFK